MLFDVFKVETKADIIYVSGNTYTGCLKGIWKSKTAPETGVKYNIELSFADTVGKNVYINNGILKPGMDIDGGRVIFNGVCEDIDETYFIRFSADALEMIDLENADINIQKGDMLIFSAAFDEIEIYPY